MAKFDQTIVNIVPYFSPPLFIFLIITMASMSSRRKFWFEIQWDVLLFDTLFPSPAFGSNLFDSSPKVKVSYFS